MMTLYLSLPVSPGRLTRVLWAALSTSAMVAVGTGCGNISLSVQYSPLAATESLVDRGERLRISVIRFTDQREDRDDIGSMKNVFGTRIKKIVTTDDLGMVLAEATTDALRKAGVDTDQRLDRRSDEDIPAKEREGYDLVVGGRLKSAHVESKPAWNTVKVNADIVIEVLIRRGDRAEWIGPIEGTAERREVAYVSSEALSSALDTAIQNCMRNLIRHLKASGSLRYSSNQQLE